MKKIFIASVLVLSVCFSISSQEIRWTGLSVDLNHGNGASHIRAMRGEGYALIYLPGNVNVRVRLHKIQANQVQAWWNNPRTGKASDIGIFEGRPDKTFEVPVRGVDWVLVIDDVEIDYPEPGEKYGVTVK